MKIGILSVLYNQNLTEGNTWKTLLLPASEKAGKTEVVLADNSDDPQIREENRRAAEACGAVYLDMQGNRGLPAAYNWAIDRILSETDSIPETETDSQAEEAEWIVIADQDTCFPADYLQVLERTAAQTDGDVLVPAVKAGQKLLSPCRRKGSRFVPCESDAPGKEALQEAFFINTGLAFRKEVFADPEIRYDEQLFLDFVDFDLLCRLRTRARTKICFAQLPGVVLQQQFSGTEKRTAEQNLERFRHFVQDGRTFYERWYGRGMAERAVRSRALRLAVKHRDIRFFQFLKNRHVCDRV